MWGHSMLIAVGVVLEDVDNFNIYKVKLKKEAPTSKEVEKVKKLLEIKSCILTIHERY